MEDFKDTIGIFNKHAKQYQDKYMDVSLYHDTFDLFCNSIAKKDADILEVACGPGNITKYLLCQRPDFKIVGIDLAPNMLELAKINNPGAEFLLMDCRNISTIGKKYDGIVCGFCLPYLSREESIKWIGDASSLLQAGGVIYISTMEEDDHNKSGIRKSGSGDEMFINYHQADYLLDALKQYGLEIIKLQRKKHTSEDGTETTDLVLVAGK